VEGIEQGGLSGGGLVAQLFGVFVEVVQFALAGGVLDEVM